MNSSANAQAEVPVVVRTFASRLRTLLRDRLVGVYLGGSFSMGDFVESNSDFDVLILLATDLSNEDLDALADLHVRLLVAHPDAAYLEGDYVPRESLGPEGTSHPVPFFRKGRLQLHAESMLSADNIANMREHGISVFGPAPASVFPEVAGEQVREAIRRMLREAPELPTEREAASEILDLVRSYRALETGKPTTKSDGLRWGISQLNSTLHPFLRRADAVRRGAWVASDDRTLRDAFDKIRTALQDHSPETSAEE